MLPLIPLVLVNSVAVTSMPLPVPSVEEKKDDTGWSGAFTLGGIITTGNSETRTATATAETNWKGEHDAFSTNALWNFQSDENGVTQRKLYGKFQYDHFLSETSYVYGNGSAGHDFSADLHLRWTAGVGGGHEFRDDDKWTLSAEAGLSYVDESFDTDPLNPPADDPDSAFLAGRVGYAATYNGSESWEFYHKGEIFPSLQDTKDIYARLDTGAKTALTKAIYLQAQWVLDWDNTPAPDSGRDSSMFALTLGWSF